MATRAGRAILKRRRAQGPEASLRVKQAPLCNAGTACLARETSTLCTARGARPRHRFLVLYWFEREEDPGEPRLGLAVPRATGNAVARNRIKRQLREVWTERLERCSRRPRLCLDRQARAAGGGRPRTVSTGSRSGSTRFSPRPRHEVRGRRRSLGLPLYAGALPGVGQCKYHPSCSQYAIDAYKEFGFFKGTLLAGWRLLRCNPWSRGGVDYARDQKVFK